MEDLSNKAVAAGGCASDFASALVGRLHAQTPKKCSLSKRDTTAVRKAGDASVPC